GSLKVSNAGIFQSVTGGSSELGVDDNSVGLIHNNQFETLKIYPNPANDKLYLEPIAGIPVCITISDLSGRVVSTMSITCKSQLDLNQIASGTYFLQSDSDSGHSIKRFTVVK